MAGQAHHFLRYAPNMDPPANLPYAKDRYRLEVQRLYQVLDKNLKSRDFVAGQFFSIADMAIWPWATLWKRQDQDIDHFPNIKKWLERCENRPGVQNGRIRSNVRNKVNRSKNRSDRSGWSREVLRGRPSRTTRIGCFVTEVIRCTDAQTGQVLQEWTR